MIETPQDFAALYRLPPRHQQVSPLAAMAGALSGAHLGVAALPAPLLARLEEQGKGGRYIRDLAERLHRRYVDRLAGR